MAMKESDRPLPYGEVVRLAEEHAHAAGVVRGLLREHERRLHAAGDKLQLLAWYTSPLGTLRA